jgi:signal transduction histidine kinase
MNPLVASYRVRVPLALSMTAVMTATSMALALGLQTLHNLREDQGRDALQLGHAMAGLLVSALRQDDVWLAYSLLRGPDGADSQITWVLADARGRVFASNRPLRYRLDQPLAHALPAADATSVTASESEPYGGPETGAAARPVTRPDTGSAANSASGPGSSLSATADLGAQVLALQDDAAIRRLVHLPLDSEGTRVGDLFAVLSDLPFLARFYEILLGGVLVTGAVLALLLPFGWLWGRRMVTPLVRLAECMRRVEREDLRSLECPVPTGDDEIGQLGQRFAAMLGALSEQAALERRVLQAERLAAVGRVAAGVAHEINNPLGGMLMAIDTYRGRNAGDSGTDRLLDLLDRGLQQIQETVSALLVEARADHRALKTSDFEDVRTLVEPQLTRRGTTLTWSIKLNTASSLPATPVRQLLLNLVLNALNAAGETGSASVRIDTAVDQLLISVENRGQPLPPERLEHLFEPFAAPRGQTPGLGLWVCYQIVSQLHGRIEVAARGDRTRVDVQLPLHPDTTDD